MTQENKTRIFTFGTDHVHEVRPLGADSILTFGYYRPARITAPDPRAVAFKTFGNAFCTDYTPEQYAETSMGRAPERFVVVDLP